MRKIIATQYKRSIFYMEIIALILLIGLAYNFIPSKKGTQTFYIPASDINTAIKTLEENGYEMTVIDRWVLALKKIPDEGWYTTTPNRYGRIAFFYTLYKQKTDATMDVVVFAGETKEELSTRLANDMKLDKQKLLEAYNSLALFEEADILAQRYTLARKANEITTMRYILMMSQRTLDSFKQEHVKKPFSISELKIIFIIASIIQKESNALEEMPLISSVIYNRLEKKMRLQMDSTLNYGVFSHTIVTPERIKNDTSSYNTYKYKGLPPHPLGTFTLDALKASINPAKSDYLYFMLNEKGKHDFSANYTEHIAHIKTFRAYQNEKKMKEEKALADKVLEEDTNETVKYFAPNPLGDLSVEIDWNKVKL
ncbi:MAG TPA: endolytic transglycosylase MltG [Sulfurovum sp.]|nr:MAG: hypothetical protein B7Y63_08655 [Sulfurovum sp. 35-42-20]OYZ24953.1 MAG: hypothetical protein B7Y23_07515 [Sulfurovum sp. 16-42-52]OZA44940.1 MAG: hypothetical protein B7X80_06360 [Sulfurovum sp. 17-42-90]OZA59567.1 MAG: hypothetical protein B7X69_07480 [Sulfurovum sp. 39-42-12]HQR73825.1 endolytic transglycosylase MltG [Sulfurovum sp.]